MGKKKPPYDAEFPKGTVVRIKDRPALARFFREWQFHNPLHTEQLAFAGRVARVVEVGFYHGGDELYSLADVPGVWHLECLQLA